MRRDAPRGETMLSKLEHFLVMTHDVDGTRDFYRDVLGFAEGFRPELGFLGHWLYLGDTPVIHIADWVTYTAPQPAARHSGHAAGNRHRSAGPRGVQWRGYRLRGPAGAPGPAPYSLPPARFADHRPAADLSRGSERVEAGVELLEKLSCLSLHTMRAILVAAWMVTASTAAGSPAEKIVWSPLKPALGLYLSDPTERIHALSWPICNRTTIRPSPCDGQWITFTSERFGSADVFRVHPDGSGLERLTDSPSFDDQGALSTRQPNARLRFHTRGRHRQHLAAGYRDPPSAQPDT